jgi:hypothetical protein
MPDNDLSDSKATASLDKRQEPRRGDIVAGSVTTAERERILDAFAQAGFRNISQAVRVLALSFTESTSVRDAVARWWRDNVELAA